MKSLTRLWKVLADESASLCEISIERDYKTLLSRVEHEGSSFLTITLPEFAQAFERSLEVGSVASDLFKSYKMRGGLPAFLSGFLRQVFNQHTGVLLDDPSVDAVRSVRQLCLLFKKIEWECTPDRKVRALDGFVSCEEDLRDVESRLSSEMVQRLALQASILFGDVFDHLNTLVEKFDLNPKHGPGATADRKVGNQKFCQSEWTDRLESYFPFGEYVLPSWRHVSDWPVEFLKPGDERPVKVTLVPKTQKTPRIIAIEPTCMQYAQQALLDSIVPALESSRVVGPLVGFTDQQPNRDFARDGSVDGKLATLDLSEASDRVLNSVVMEILKPWPSLQGAVAACRSSRADLGNGLQIDLVKFASMGSALCFPMEEIVFLSIIVLGMQHDSAPLSREDVLKLHGRVRVYGDDIIIPVDMVNPVMGALETFGLKVNRHKSFWNGKFRESCGGDYFNGEWVTPVRMKSDLPHRRNDVESIVKTMELSNSLYKAGYWRTSRYILDRLLSVGIGDAPVPMGSQAIAPSSFQRLDDLPARWNKDLHRFEFRRLIYSPRPREISVDGLPALRKVLAGDFADPSFRNHLHHSGRPQSVRTKSGWVAVAV